MERTCHCEAGRNIDWLCIKQLKQWTKVITLPVKAVKHQWSFSSQESRKLSTQVCHLTMLLPSSACLFSRIYNNHTFSSCHHRVTPLDLEINTLHSQTRVCNQVKCSTSANWGNSPKSVEFLPLHLFHPFQDHLFWFGAKPTSSTYTAITEGLNFKLSLETWWW